MSNPNEMSTEQLVAAARKADDAYKRLHFGSEHMDLHHAMANRLEAQAKALAATRTDIPMLRRVTAADVARVTELLRERKATGGGGGGR